MFIQAKNGYSLPKNQTPSVLPLKSASVVMPVSFGQIIIRPDFLNGWAMLTSGTPFSRAAAAPPIQSTMTSAPPPAITCSGAMFGPPGRIVDVEVLLGVEALGLGDEVAGELRLRHPLELQPHRVLRAGRRSAGERQRARRQCYDQFLHSRSLFPVYYARPPRTDGCQKVTALSMRAITP